MGKRLTLSDLRNEVESEADEDEERLDSEDGATSPGPEEASEIVVVPRDKPHRIEWREPVSGKRRVATVTFTVPNADTRNTLGRMVERFLGGMPWLRAPTPEQVRAYQLAECAQAIKDEPDWLLPALQEDDDFREYVHGGVIAHAINFRFGNLPEGREDQVPPRFLLAPVGTPSPPTKSS